MPLPRFYAPTTSWPAILPPEIESLVHLFPALRRAAAIAERLAQGGEPPPADTIRRSAAAALTSLLTRLAAHLPVIVSVDDLQWGDLDSAPFLIELTQARGGGILLLGTYRNDGAAEAELVTALRNNLRTTGAAPQARVLSLGRLRDEDIADLVAKVSGEPRDTALVQRLAHEAEGNAFFAAELAFAGGTVASARVHKLDALIAQRVDELPNDAQRLLQVTALAAKPQPVDILVRAARVRDVARTLAQLRAGRFLRMLHTRAGEHVTTYHDRVRETVVAHIDPQLARKLHRRLARAFEAAPEAERDLEALVHHWRGAGTRDRARRYALLAADRALAARAYVSAAAHLGTAIELSADDDDDALELELLRADALQRGGQLAAAAAAFAAAAHHAPAELAADLHARAMVCLLRAGRLGEAIDASRAAAPALGGLLPRSTAAAVAAITGQRLTLLGRRLDVRRPRDERECDPAELQRTEVALDTAAGLTFIDPLLGYALHGRALRRALRAREPKRVVVALNYEALLNAALWGKRGARTTNTLLDRGRRLAEAHAPTSYVAAVDGWRGFARLLEYDDLETGLALLERGVAGLEHDPRFAYDADQLRLAMVNVMATMGTFALLSERLPVLMRSAHESGNLFLFDSLRRQGGVYTWLVADAPREGENQAGLSSDIQASRPTLSEFYGRAALAEIALYRGQPEAAWQHVAAFWRRLSRSSLALCALPRGYPAMIAGRTALACARTRPHEQALWLGRALALARSIQRERLRMPTFARSHASAIRGMVAAIRGHQDTAVEMLSCAIDALDSVGVRLWEGPLRLRLGQLLGGDEGAEQMNRYYAWAKQECIGHPDRWAAALYPPLR